MSKALSIAPPPIFFYCHRRIWSSRPSLLSFGHLHHLPIPIRTCLISAVGSEATASAWSAEEGPSQDLLSLDLQPISSEGQFDRIIAEAQQLEESVIIVWMAGWCRKCIYLKPKLEKLAVDYYPRIRFYCIDVNTVPQRLVNRAGITLWKDGIKQAEVIGGHKAWLVVGDVREMIENEG
ncbi:thioredoxin-like 3-2, chloroplastic isoform X2 [Magnolia sinica]|uniref:thioredoxin-like 3-2, chloroplastic isoform X2 n=1 Tax=Magnolia sinica TaxID=86752 RepID=UPI00265AF7F0|nr:thioredoxin-like 3-2, chloroplastic isoform X2 [Magnolia sinica]